jgi:NADH:ubiquinone oxidoreductase subunit
MTATIGTRIYTFFLGRSIGTDAFGNRYYEERGRVKNRRRRRWVMYKGLSEASKVPANWHGWLHYTHDKPLPEAAQYPWQKEHLPNLTGTALRYLPPGHASKSGARAANPADYIPWTPR